MATKADSMAAEMERILSLYHFRPVNLLRADVLKHLVGHDVSGEARDDAGRWTKGGGFTGSLPLSKIPHVEQRPISAVDEQQRQDVLNMILEADVDSPSMPERPQEDQFEDSGDYEQAEDDWYGEAADAYLSDADKHIAELVKDAKVKVRIPLHILTDHLLADGRLRSQHEFVDLPDDERESAAGSGWFEPFTRGEIESEPTGIPNDDDMDPRLHPIYGFLDDGTQHYSDKLDSYGEVTLNLKDSVRKRTYFTLGDSLANNYNVDRGEVEWRMQPVPLLGPTEGMHRAYNYGERPNDGPSPFKHLNADKASVFNVHGFEDLPDYAEAQIIGGVGLKDIESIDMGTRKMKAETRAKFKALGIEVSG